MNHEIAVQVKNQLSEIPRLIALVEAFAGKHQLPGQLAGQISLVLDELLTNVISYGYRDAAEHLIDLHLELSEEELTLVIEDDGLAFNPLDQAAPQLDKPIAERDVGGLGIFLVRKTMDSLESQRQPGKNILIMKKKVTLTSPAKSTYLEIMETKSGEVLVLEFKGRFDSLTAPDALKKLTATIETGAQRLVLDFSQLDYISSAGLQVLLVTLDKLQQAQGKIALCCLKDYLKDIFDIVGLTKLFPIHRSRAEALSSIQ